MTLTAPKFAIGDKFKTRGKHPRECTVVDILTTTNAAGNVVRIRYLAEHQFCGQTVAEEVPELTIAISLGIPYATAA